MVVVGHRKSKASKYLEEGLAGGVIILTGGILEERHRLCTKRKKGQEFTQRFKMAHDICLAAHLVNGDAGAQAVRSAVANNGAGAAGRSFDQAQRLLHTTLVVQQLSINHDHLM